MSEKKDITRAELVRLRREKENSQRRERAKKDATRPVPTVTTRAKPAVAKPKRKSTRNDSARNPQSARRRFQIALLPVAPDAKLRGITLPRPRLGPRLFSFFVVVLLGVVLYCAFSLPAFRVGVAQVTGSQILSPAEI